MPAMDPAALQALARHADVIATVRRFVHDSGALRAIVLLDQGDAAAPVTVECEGDGAVALADAEQELHVPAGQALPAPARPLPEVRAIPATTISVDPATDRLSAPIGAIQQLGDALLALARVLGGRSVATADFATSAPEVPITLAAREGEPLVLVAGEQTFELGA